MSDVSCETNIPRLQWRRVSDTRMQSECGRYIVDREPDYERFPAMGYRYTAKRADLQEIRSEPFETFALAAGVCEIDLTMQQTQKG